MVKDLNLMYIFKRRFLVENGIYINIEIFIEKLSCFMNVTVKIKQK